MPQSPKHRTTPREWFGVGIRLFALWPLFLAVQQLLTFIHFRMGMSITSYSYDANPDGFLLYAIGYGAFALFLLRAAPFVIMFAYPEPVMDSDDDSAGAEESSASAD